MRLSKLKDGINLVSATGTLLCDAALTIGPPLLRLRTAGKEGAAYAGLVREADQAKPDPIGRLTPDDARPFAGRVSYVCVGCGSDDVQVNAWAAWNDKTQAWECISVFPRDGECAHCGSQSHIRAVPLQPQGGRL